MEKDKNLLHEIDQHFFPKEEYEGLCDKCAEIRKKQRIKDMIVFLILSRCF
jgi:hypothetical protein